MRGPLMHLRRAVTSRVGVITHHSGEERAEEVLHTEAEPLLGTVTGKAKTTRTYPEKGCTRRSTVSSNSAQSGTNPTRPPSGRQSCPPALKRYSQLAPGQVDGG